MEVEYNAELKGICAKRISITLSGELKNTRIDDLDFIGGGCIGNQTAIKNLCKGRKVTEIIPLLSGISCGNKGTSCADQLAQILEQCFIKHTNINFTNNEVTNEELN